MISKRVDLKQTLVIASILLLLQRTNGYSTDVSHLPNGDNIPCPPDGVNCVSGMCPGSGHRTSANKPACDGSPPITNAFGNSFSSQGRLWTYNLCTLDSDGDGKTNGDELGDPCCVWSQASGNAPRRTSLISHPYSTSAKTTAPSCLLEGAPAALSTAPTATPGSVSLDLNWDEPAATSCYCGVAIYKKVAGGGYSQAAYVPFGSTSYSDTDVQPDTQYSYYVVLTNLAGNSTAGAEVTVKTTGPQSPLQPSPPYITGATTTSISLAWTDPGDNGSPITSYRLNRDGVLVYSGPNAFYTDENLVPEMPHQYSVAAANAFGDGTFSDVASYNTNSEDATVATDLPAPRIVGGDSTSIILEWDEASTPGATILSYILEFKIADGDFSEVYEGIQTGGTATGLDPQIQYSFRYSVVNTVGRSDPSAVLETFTVNCPNDCSDHGTCEPSNSTCLCDPGFGGDDCSQSDMSSSIDADSYSNSIALTTDFKMYWRIDGDEIEIGLQANVAGYLAIGFTSGKSESTADMIVGWVSDGKIYMQDYYNHDRSTIYLDEVLEGSNSILAYNGEEVDGVTSLKFRRKLNTNDSHDMAITAGNIDVLYALSESDPADFTSVPQHSGDSAHRGWATVDFFTGEVGDNRRQLIVAHGVLMTVAIFCFLLAMMRRYLVRWTGKFLQYLYYGLTAGAITCVICGLLLGIWADTGNHTSVHAILGFIVSILFFIFPPFGIIAELNAQKTKIFPHYFHRVLERLAVYLGIAVGAIGLKEYAAPGIYFALFLAVSLILVVIHEILFIALHIFKVGHLAETKQTNRKSVPAHTTLTPEMFMQGTPKMEEVDEHRARVVRFVSPPSSPNPRAVPPSPVPIIPAVNPYYQEKMNEVEMRRLPYAPKKEYANIPTTISHTTSQNNFGSSPPPNFESAQAPMKLATLRGVTPMPPPRPRGVTNPVPPVRPAVDLSARNRAPTAPSPRTFTPQVTESPNNRTLPAAPLMSPTSRPRPQPPTIPMSPTVPRSNLPGESPSYPDTPARTAKPSLPPRQLFHQESQERITRPLPSPGPATPNATMRRALPNPGSVPQSPQTRPLPSPRPQGSASTLQSPVKPPPRPLGRAAPPNSPPSNRG